MAGNKFQRYKPAARHKTTSINRHLSRRPGKEDINLQYGQNFGQLIFPKEPYNLAVSDTELSVTLEYLRRHQSADWRMMTLEQKRILYDGYFRETLLEVYRKDDRWKGMLGIATIALAFSLSIQRIYQQVRMAFRPPSSDFWYTWSNEEFWQHNFRRKADRWQNRSEQGRLFVNWDYSRHGWTETGWLSFKIS